LARCIEWGVLHNVKKNLKNTSLKEIRDKGKAVVEVLKEPQPGYVDLNKRSLGVKQAAKITSHQAKQAAEKLGFKKINYYSNGQPVFQKGKKFITVDVDSHSGGVWKMADSIKNLARKNTRMGTYDQFLNRIGD